MGQSFLVYLDLLKATLDVEENGAQVRYLIDLDSERKDALIERNVLTGDDLAPVETRSALMTLDQLRGAEPHDVTWARAHHVVWAARGMWGIPVEFGPKSEPVPEVAETITL